jgi:hypothetical protein
LTPDAFKSSVDGSTAACRRVAWMQGTVPVLAAFVAAVAVSVLVAWSIGGPGFQQRWPELFVMKTNTAINLLLRAVALAGLWRVSGGVRVAVGCSIRCARASDCSFPC